jgi:hypothetical protein
VFSTAKLWRICIEDPFESHQTSISHDLGRHVNLNEQQIISQKIDDAFHQLTCILNNLTISCTTNERILQDCSQDQILMLYRSLAHDFFDSHTYSHKTQRKCVQEMMKRVQRFQNLSLQNNCSKNMNIVSTIPSELSASKYSHIGRVAVKGNSEFVPTTIVQQSLDAMSIVTVEKLSKENHQRKSPVQDKFPLPDNAPAEDICIQDATIHETSREKLSVQEEETLSSRSYTEIINTRILTNPTKQAAATMSKDGKIRRKKTPPAVSQSASVLTKETISVQQKGSSSKSSSAKKASMRTDPTKQAATKANKSKDGKMKRKQTPPAVRQSASVLAKETISVQKKGSSSKSSSTQVASIRTDPPKQAALQAPTSKDGKMKRKHTPPAVSQSVSVLAKETISEQQKGSSPMRSSAKKASASMRTDPVEQAALQATTSKANKMRGDQLPPIVSLSAGILAKATISAQKKGSQSNSSSVPQSSSILPGKQQKDTASKDGKLNGKDQSQLRVMW